MERGLQITLRLKREKRKVCRSYVCETVGNIDGRPAVAAVCYSALANWVNNVTPR